MALSIAYWTTYTMNKSKMQRKSENSVESRHVLKFVYNKELERVKAVVQASMRDRSYTIQVGITCGRSLYPGTTFIIRYRVMFLPAY